MTGLVIASVLESATKEDFPAPKKGRGGLPHLYPRKSCKPAS